MLGRRSSELLLSIVVTKPVPRSCSAAAAYAVDVPCAKPSSSTSSTPEASTKS